MRIILATNNQNKVKEMANILDREVYSLKDLDYNIDIEETGTTFKENAYIKAHAISEKYPFDIVISDDSGLEVDALNGAPGVYSARYSFEQTDSANNELLLKNLEGIKNRKARFVCMICVIINGEAFYFDGLFEGEIATSATGNAGFGYDPIFLYNEKSVASLTSVEKNKISHRAKALKKVSEFLKER